MPEQMTKQDAIEYLLYMKHDVQAKIPMDIALDTAIEALRQPTIEPKRGRWKKVSEKSPKYVCTNCNHLFNNRSYKFCPNCGAHMREGGADNG